MKGKEYKILVTGSAGFIGCHTYDLLASLGHDVYGLDDLSGGFMDNVSNKKKFFKIDLCDRKKTADIINMLKPEIIFHLAADAHEGRSQFTPLSASDRNYFAYMNLLVPAIKNGLKKMILTSTMAVYGEGQVPFREKVTPTPGSVYGISKYAMEMVTKSLAEAYGFSYVIIRPHNVYGPKQNISDPYRNVIGIFVNQLLHNRAYYIYGGDQKRAYSSIEDVIPPMIEAAFLKSCEGKTFNLGSDSPITLRKLSDAILKEFFDGGKVPPKLKPRYLPRRPYEVKYAYCSHDEASKYLGYKPKMDLGEGLRNIIAWAREKGPQKFVYLDDLELPHRLTPKTWTERLY